MNQKQQAAKTAINELAIDLLSLVNQEAPYSDADISTIKNLALKIRYETNDLNDYEALERIFDLAK
jgi:outer membrane receptor for Fe3+-dicitrate